MADKILNSFDVWIGAQGWKSRLRLKSVDNIRLEGVARLRELILELAIRGKLVPQDPSDEPANVLLSKIEKEKENLISEGKIKKERIFSQVSDSEKLFDLPLGWEWTRIQSVGHDWGQKEPTEEFSYIEVSGIDRSKGIINEAVLTPHTNAPSRARKIVKKGTVIYSTVRPYLKNICMVDRDFSPEPIASTAFAIVHPLQSMPGKYFVAYFRSPTFVRYVESIQIGIAYPAINDGQFFSGLVPVPPLKEQHRIVAKVDELMALCDELEQQETNHLKSHQLLVETLLGTLTQAKDAAEFQTAWATLAQHFDDLFITEDSIDQLKQTILQLAVMGKLVPQDPKDEPASVLLERVQKEKERLVEMKKIKKTEPLASIADFDKPFELPEKWKWCRFGDLLRSMAYGTSQKTDDNEDNVPVLRMGNITSAGKLTYGNLKYISPDHEDLPNLYLENGDIVFNRTNSYELVGKSGVYKGASNCYTLASYLIKASPFVDITNSDFLNLYINSPVCRKTQIEPEITAQTNQANFSGSKLKNVILPLPPAKEQDRIVERIDELVALCDRLKERLAEAQKAVNLMAEAVVELV